ncbi:MAG: hypothetical protein ACREU7_00280, partial [Burkholderiales bacterium]
LGLALWSFFASLWIYLPKLRGWPALGAVLIVWLALSGAPDHSLRDTTYKDDAALQKPPLAGHFEQWRATTLPDAEKSPIFLVAAAGGGLRAAFWTANLLAAMDDATCGQFGRHVYAYSGVSGGSLGVAAYLAQRQVWEAKRDLRERCAQGRREEITRMLGRDFLAPVAGSTIFAELAHRLLHIPLDNERGTALAKSWSSAWDDVFGPDHVVRFDARFLEVFSALPSGTRDGVTAPAVFFNATSVDSGRRVVSTNVKIRDADVPGSVDLHRESPWVALKTAGLRLREAVLNSARFTYVSPAGTVYACYRPAAVRDENGNEVRPPALDQHGKCEPDREKIWDRVVDGGYFENSGLATLMDVVHFLMPSNPAAADDEIRKSRQLRSRVYIIVIDNSSEPELACPPSGWQRPVRTDVRTAELSRTAGLAAPIEALLNVREAHARLEVRRARLAFKCPRHLIDWSLLGAREEQLEARQARQQPALGWFLSTRSAIWMLSRV